MLTQYAEQLIRYRDLGISLDFSLLPLSPEFLSSLSVQIERAFSEIKLLEKGHIANPDENRMVGHYWLRNSDLAPTPELKALIDGPIAEVKAFGEDILSGKITAPSGQAYKTALIIGIGGSALGPELVADALPNTGLKLAFLDNTDPEGIWKVLESLNLADTLAVVISKSGGTPETRNGMLEAQAAYQQAGLNFAAQAVAVTGVASQLDIYAESQGWLKRFPMEDWVGGRTSLMSVVGLVPAALQGLDIDAFLEGAREMDKHTRETTVADNAAMKLALAWYKAGNGKGEKDMVVLPYKDSLVLFSKYLQQLIMESIGKKEDLDGKVVHQGLAVYGNKGSTDQHAYVQQLRDGIANFFAVFIEVRKAKGRGIEVAPGVQSGDFLQGFLRGTRAALAESGRPSITISVPEVNAKILGALIALFERAVSFYASLVHINAYHQPGVEAGKKAAGIFLDLLSQVRHALTSQPTTASKLAIQLGEDAENVYHCLVHIAENDKDVLWSQADNALNDTFSR